MTEHDHEMPHCIPMSPRGKGSSPGKIDRNQNQNHRTSIYEKIVSKYDQEIPQSQTADNPMAPRGRATQPSRDTRKTI